MLTVSPAPAKERPQNSEQVAKPSSLNPHTDIQEHTASPPISTQSPKARMLASSVQSPNARQLTGSVQFPKARDLWG